MADVRDILGVARANASSEKPDAPAKQPKERMQRPAGMSREAFALLGGSHPIVPSVLTEELRKKEDLKGLKQKRKASAKGQARLLLMHHCQAMQAKIRLAIALACMRACCASPV